MRRFIVEVTREQFEKVNKDKKLSVILFNNYYLYQSDVFIFSANDNLKSNFDCNICVRTAIDSFNLNILTESDQAILLSNCIVEGERSTLGLSRVRV